MDDNERFTRYWTEAQPIVAAYISTMVPDFAAAEDLLQEVAVVLLRKYSAYDPSRSFVSWALGVAKFEVLSLRRSQARSLLSYQPELVESLTELCEEMAPELEQRSLALRECLKKVQGRARKLIELRYDECLRPGRIAVRLGMGAVAVRVMLSRVRASLRTCVQQRLKQEELA
jgi:RNA polymerase sigma-70 factor (ECF subfamily)